MSDKDFAVGDLVWTKMKGYPPWPSKIAQPPANSEVKSRKAQYWIYFFGSKNCAWVPVHKICPHGEEMLQEIKNKSAAFHKAVEEIVSESKALGKRNVQEKDKANSIEIPVKKQNKNEALKAKKSILKKKALIKKSRKERVQEFVLKKAGRTNGPGSSSALCPKNILDVPDSINKCNEGARSEEKKIKNPPNLPTAMSKNRKCILPPAPPSDIKCVKESLKAKDDVKSTSNKIGFLGLGVIGQRIVRNLLNAGHDVTVWNRTPEKCDAIVEAGARRGQTPADVIQACDITFCCVSDPEASKAVVSDNCGVLKGLEGCTPGKKAYVELTGIDPQTSQEIANKIYSKGGRYLEARILGSRSLAESGLLLVLAAGDLAVFQACEGFFSSFCKHAYFISLDVGSASKMGLIVNMFHGTVTGLLAEALSLTQSCKLSINDFLDFMEVLPACSPLVKEKGKAMKNKDFSPNFAIKHQERDFENVIQLADSINQPLQISAAAHKVFKRAKLRQYSNYDVSAVIQAIR